MQSPTALDEMVAREARVELPGYTHMQQAMPSSVALWAGGFAAELRDDAEGLRACSDACEKSPLGSAAGLWLAELAARPRAHARSVSGSLEVQQPVTAVQLSRGKAEAQVCSRSRW